jgi:hypothetical protein
MVVCWFGHICAHDNISFMHESQLFSKRRT